MNDGKEFYELEKWKTQGIQGIYKGYKKSAKQKGQKKQHKLEKELLQDRKTDG